MNTLMIAGLTSLLSLSAVAEPVATDMLVTDTFSAEMHTKVQQYTTAFSAQLSTELATETLQQANQALFSTALSLLSFNNADQNNEKNVEYIVQHMMVLAKRLAAHSAHAE